MLLVYVALQGQLLLSCLSSASLTLAIQDPTGSLVFAPDVPSVIRFSLSGFSQEKKIDIYVHHKPGNTSDYTSLCHVHQQRDICTPDPVDVCQCLTREPDAAKYEIRKVFHHKDSGVLRFIIWVDGRHEETFNITVVSTSSHGATVALMSTDPPDVQNFTTERRGLSSDKNDDSSSSNATNVINITVIASCLAIVVSACVVFVVAARCFLKRPGTAQRPQQENFASGTERTNSQTGNPGLVSSSFSGGQYEHAWYSAKADEDAYTEIDTCGHGTYLSPQELRSEHSEPS